MKIRLKKIISLVLVLAISFTISIPAFAAEKRTNINEILKQAPNYFDEDYQKQIEETNDKIMKSLQRSGGSKYLSVPLYQQEKYYYCGPASAQMVLKYVTGTKYSQSSLASEMGTNSIDGTIVYKLARELNKKIGYNAYQFVNTSDRSFTNGLMYSIDNHKPVICHTLTDGLPTYGENGCKHYIVATGYAWEASGTQGMDNVRYNDPNNVSSHFGTHNTNWQKMINAINSRLGFYIMKS